METVAVADDSIETLAANLSGAPQRRTLDGREYLVSPITIFPPGGGVMNGSKGPLFYSGQVCRANPGAWNDVPITGRHPMSANGKHVSADDPDVLKKQKIGFLVNDHEDNGRRRVWGWLDVENARDYDHREGTSILSDWEAGRLQEVSTGLHTDDSPAQNGANHNGRNYAWTVTSWRPDHLAVLPDQRGACSITDGCGVNNADANQSVLKTAWNKMGQLLGFSVANSSDIVDGSVRSSPAGGAKLAWQESSLEAAQAGAVKGASCGLDCECEDCDEKRVQVENAFCPTGDGGGQDNSCGGGGGEKGDGYGEAEKVSSKSVKAGDMIFTSGDWHPVKSVEVEEGYQTTVTLVGSPDVHAASGQDDVLRYSPGKKVDVKRKTVENAGRYGNPQSTATGFYKRHGSGTGKGEHHEAAQRGAMVITERDRELGTDAAKQLQETGSNPASWVADEATWERAKAAADKGNELGSDGYWAIVAHIYKNMGGEMKDTTGNAFCATGEGGGVDPSCSGDGSGGGEKDGKERGNRGMAWDASKTASSWARAGKAETVQGARHAAGLHRHAAGLQRDAAKAHKTVDPDKKHEKKAVEHDRLAKFFQEKAKQLGDKTHNEQSLSGDSLDLSQGDSPMTLNGTQRKTIVTELTANCDCWNGGEETLNEMSDERLVALGKAHKDATDNAVVANAVKTVLKPPSTLTANEMPAFIKSKIEAKEAVDEEDEESGNGVKECKEDCELDEEETENARRIARNSQKRKPQTAEQWLTDPSVPAEIRSAASFAMNAERSQKATIVQQLVANVEDDKRRERLAGRYMRMTLNDLQDELATRPQVARNARQEESETIGFYFGGIGQAPTANAGEDADLVANAELMEMPTLDFKALSGNRKTA